MQQTVCYHAWWSFYRVNATSQGRFQTYRSDTVIVFTKFKVKSDLQWFLFFPSAFSRSLMFLSKGAHAFVFTWLPSSQFIFDLLLSHFNLLISDDFLIFLLLYLASLDNDYGCNQLNLPWQFKQCSVVPDLPAWREQKDQQKFLGGRGGEGEGIFSYYFGGGNWNFYDPEIEICKINYCKNKVKLNNKDNSKNNINGIRKLFNLSISFPFSLQFKNFLQLAFTYSNSTIKTQEQGVQCLKIANTGNWKDTRKM